MTKYTKAELFDMMVADTRIASWVRTEYRNMQKAPAKEPETKKTEPAKAEEVAS